MTQLQICKPRPAPRYWQESRSTGLDEKVRLCHLIGLYCVTAERWATSWILEIDQEGWSMRFYSAAGNNYTEVAKHWHVWCLTGINSFNPHNIFERSRVLLFPFLVKKTKGKRTKEIHPRSMDSKRQNWALNPGTRMPLLCRILVTLLHQSLPNFKVQSQLFLGFASRRRPPTSPWAFQG